MIEQTPSFKQRGYFLLIDTDGSRRSRVNEARERLEPYQTVSTVYFKLGILRTELWSQGTFKLAPL